MSLARCIYNCDDNGECENECVSQFKGRTSNCPCEVSMMITVELFSFQLQFLYHLNIIQENCPAGCPCDFYDCDDVSPTVSPTTTTSVVTTSTTTEPVAKDAVLMLSTRYNNVPMVIGYKGKFNFEIL